MYIEVTRSDFNHQQLYEYMRAHSPQAGAIVTFTGLVRDTNVNGSIESIELEHYPGMTEKALTALAEKATTRFALQMVAIVHRIGVIKSHEQIVFVGCSALHRQAAFDGASYVMDMLKQSVPLWKKEHQQGISGWVEAKQSDEKAAMAWLKNE